MAELNKPVVYIDMDGVLVDLDLHMVELFGDEHPDILENRDIYFRRLPDLVDVYGFINARPMKNLHQFEILVNRIEEAGGRCAILTSHGSFYIKEGIDYSEEVVRQKRQWLKNNTSVLKHIMFNATPSGAAKAQYADHKAFLIDDHKGNVEKFVKAGGKAYHYENAGHFSNAFTEALNFVKSHAL